MKESKSLVSIIIPTKNAVKSLQMCLESINNQTYKNVEVILVDNFSSDDTVKIAKSLGATTYKKGPERGAQKNYGAEKAQGEYIFFVDVDMELSPTVIEECVKVMDKYDAVMVPEQSVGEGFWNACVILERSCYVGDDHTEAARFFKKKVFKDVGGFNLDLVASGDDMDLSQKTRREGYKLGRIKSYIKHHEGQRTPWTTYKKWRYYGRDMGKYVMQNKKEAAFQYMPIRPAWIKNWKILIADPIHTVGFIFLKMCQLAGVIMGQIDILVNPREKLKYNPYSSKE